MRGRGCGFVLVLAIGAGQPLAAGTGLQPPAEKAALVMLPSGLEVTLREVLLDKAPGALWVRFRFLAPEISRDGGRVSYAQAGPDMDYLCEALALDYLRSHQITPERVVISLSDRMVPLGVQDAGATQFFEVYSLQDGHCIWEEF